MALEILPVVAGVFFKIHFWAPWVFVAVSELSLVAESWGCFLAAVHKLLTAVASLVVEHGLSVRGFQ